MSKFQIYKLLCVFMLLLSLYNNKYVNVDVSVNLDVNELDSNQKAAFKLILIEGLLKFISENSFKLENKRMSNIYISLLNDLEEDKTGKLGNLYSLISANGLDFRSKDKADISIENATNSFNEFNVVPKHIEINIEISSTLSTIKPFDKKLKLDYIQFDYSYIEKQGISFHNHDFKELKRDIIFLYKKLQEEFKFKQSFKIDDQENPSKIEEYIKNSTSVGLKIASLDDITIEFIKPDDTQKLML